MSSFEVLLYADFAKRSCDIHSLGKDLICKIGLPFIGCSILRESASIVDTKVAIASYTVAVLNKLAFASQHPITRPVTSHCRLAIEPLNEPSSAGDGSTGGLSPPPKKKKKKNRQNQSFKIWF